MTSNLNPLLKHPILREVSYEMMKNPTLEEIREEISKRKIKTKRRGIFQAVFHGLVAIFFIVQLTFGLSTLWNSFIILGAILFVGMIPYDIAVAKKNARKYDISDEEIVEVIEEHGRWVNKHIILQ